MVPQSEYVLIAEAGHMIAGDANDAFGEAVLGFLGRALG
jgi:non-heme chloroperoxidase